MNNASAKFISPGYEEKINKITVEDNILSIFDFSISFDKQSAEFKTKIESMQKKITELCCDQRQSNKELHKEGLKLAINTKIANINKAITEIEQNFDTSKDPFTKKNGDVNKELTDYFNSRLIDGLYEYYKIFRDNIFKASLAAIKDKKSIIAVDKTTKEDGNATTVSANKTEERKLKMKNPFKRGPKGFKGTPEELRVQIRGKITQLSKGKNKEKYKDKITEYNDILKKIDNIKNTSKINEILPDINKYIQTTSINFGEKGKLKGGTYDKNSKTKKKMGKRTKKRTFKSKFLMDI
jgi:hypothetical protein